MCRRDSGTSVLVFQQSSCAMWGLGGRDRQIDGSRER